MFKNPEYKVVGIVLSLQFLLFAISAQEGMYSGKLETTGSITTADFVPFWFRVNQFGSVPLDGPSLSFVGAYSKNYKKDNKHLADWGFGLEGRANLGNRADLLLIEGFGKVKMGVFELRGGRSKEITGLCDTSLTSGSWTLSGSALGVPKVQLAIQDFYTLPFLGHMFAFKGRFAHGWVGEAPIYYQSDIIHVKTWLHEKQLYGRFGKEEWKLKLFGGFNHQVYWGNEREYHGDPYELSTAQTFYRVVTGGSYGNDSILTTRIGNQLGSLDMGLEYTFRKIQFFAYHLFLYDIGALSYGENIMDGLTGVSVINLKPEVNRIGWKKFLIEFLYTKNQAGETWSGHTASGDENYFNSSYYLDGWSYQGKSLGNPFISPKNSTREELPCHPKDFFNNNRIVLFHLGCEAYAYGWDLLVKASYSFNYGTHGTSEAGHSVGDVHHEPIYGTFGEKKQFSAFASGARTFKKNWILSCSVAFDAGNLYNENYGLMLGLGKIF